MSNWNGKWNYEVCFNGNMDDVVKKRFEIAQIQEVFGVNSLKLNHFESLAIQSTLKIINGLLREYGFQNIPVSNNQIIVINKKKFDSKVSMRGYERGKIHTGHVYLIKNTNKAKFIHDLTHEISHLFSFYSLNIKKKREKLSIRQEKTGYCITLEDDTHFFEGLNEATTEMFAAEIRLRLVEDYNLLSKKEGSYLCNYFVYLPQIILLKKIITSFGKNELTKDDLFKSYISGDDVFLNSFNDELIKHLSLMGIDNELPFETAFNIGGFKLVRHMIKEMKNFKKP